MASEIDHIRLANKNQDCLDHLLSEVARFPEWVATIAFYKAIHLVEAAFKNLHNVDSTSHSNREHTLKTSPKLQIYFTDYQYLNTASRVARYLHADQSNSRFSTFTDYLTCEEVREKLVFKRLFRFEQNILQYLSDNGKKQLTKVNRQLNKPDDDGPTLAELVGKNT